MLRARRAPLRRVGAPLQRAGARRARQSRERPPRRASASALGAGGGGGEGGADEDKDKDKDKGTLSAADLASLRERIDLVETKERQIADIEGVFSSIEGMLGVRILDEKGRWRPFERAGWRGWAVVALAGVLPLLTTAVLWRDFAGAGRELTKLL